MSNAYFLTEQDRAKLRELSRRVDRLRFEIDARQMHTGGASLGNAKWKNTHASTCPPGGIIKLSNIQLDSDSTGDYYYEGTRPDGTISTPAYLFAINGTEEVIQDGSGSCTLIGYTFVKTSDITTYARGTKFYAGTNTWLAQTSGYLVGYLTSSGTCLSAGVLTPCIIETPKQTKALMGIAKTNWKKNAGVYPSAAWAAALNPEHGGYVYVNNITDGRDTADELKVWLPTGPGRDPNVIEGQQVTFMAIEGLTDGDNADGQLYESIGNHDDDAVGTVKMIVPPSRIQPGWAICNGSQDTSKTASGAAVDMTDRFPLGNSGSSGDGTLTISDDSVCAAIQEHSYDDRDGGPTGTVSDGRHLPSGTDIVLTHNIIQTPGTHYVPKHQGIYFIERIDNSA
jgi:hypothetical protein